MLPGSAPSNLPPPNDVRHATRPMAFQLPEGVSLVLRYVGLVQFSCFVFLARFLPHIREEYIRSQGWQLWTWGGQLGRMCAQLRPKIFAQIVMQMPSCAFTNTSRTSFQVLFACAL